MDVTDLRLFLEEETDDIAHTIQDMLKRMRVPGSSGTDLSRSIQKISEHMDRVLRESGPAFQASGDRALGQEASALLESLRGARDRLEGLGYDILEDPESKGVKQSIANTSYEIAKLVKGLLGLLE